MGLLNNTSSVEYVFDFFHPEWGGYNFIQLQKDEDLVIENTELQQGSLAQMVLQGGYMVHRKVKFGEYDAWKNVTSLKFFSSFQIFFATWDLDLSDAFFNQNIDDLHLYRSFMQLETSTSPIRFSNKTLMIFSI